jgi:hypothetical protein
MKPPTCQFHPAVLLRCPACIGQKGGKATSPKKLRALRKSLRLARAAQQGKA